MIKILEIIPHDPLVLRDNRFNNDALHMFSVDWVLPSVLGGSLRTALGKLAARVDQQPAFSKERAEQLRKIAVVGPFPTCAGANGAQMLAFPVPGDALAFREGNSVTINPIRPAELPADGGCDLPEDLLPATLMGQDACTRAKPEPLKGFWSLDRMVTWLTNPAAQRCNAAEAVDVKPPALDKRTHVKINPENQSAEEKHLFVTQGRVFTTPLSVRVEADATYENHLTSFVHPLGGERRLASWRTTTTVVHGWDCPKEVTTALRGAKQVRMVLATPALFKNGWSPGWLDSKNEGYIPDTQVRVKLESAIIPRWQAISGWDFQQGGAKPIRRMVPAGAVYFFKVLDGDVQQLSAKWLAPLSDLDNPGEPEGLCRNDGFGAPLWGIW